MKIYQSAGEAGSEQIELAEVVFGPEPEDPGKLFISDFGIRVGREVELHFSGAYGLVNQNLMVTVRHGDSQILTAACHWGNVNPYFAFRAPGDNLVELYFER